MAVFDPTRWIALTRTVFPTDAQLAAIGNWDAGLGAIGMENLWRHSFMFLLPLGIATAINNNTKSSLEFTAPFPFKVVACKAGVESAAGTTCTADLEKNPSGSPDTFATMAGATDVKTAAGEFVDVPILDGAEDVDGGDQLRLTVVGGGAGAVVGAAAVLVCFRR